MRRRGAVEPNNWVIVLFWIYAAAIEVMGEREAEKIKIGYA
jgi:hypothetical protein